MYVGNEEEELSRLLGSEFVVSWKRQTESTNDDVKRILKENRFSKIVVCLSDSQIKGRGTHGRIWENEDDAILISIGGFKKTPYPEMMPVLGWNLMKLCQKIDPAVRIKWPNDLWINEKKFAGILCETTQSGGKNKNFAIGIGINLSGSNVNHAYLRISKERKISFCAELVHSVVCSVEDFSTTELQRVSEQWNQFDALFGCCVFVSDAKGRIIKGVEKGINKKGELLLERDSQTYAFSDATLGIYSGREE